MSYLFFSIVSFLVSIVFTIAVRHGALYFHVVDDPVRAARKHHKEPVPLWGGFALVLSFLLSIGVVVATQSFIWDSFQLMHLIGVMGGAFLLLIGGILDDRYTLRPWQQISFVMLAIALVVSIGISIAHITNPFGGVFTLSASTSIVLVSVWLLATTYATKVLDGLDGLVAGLTVIGASVIAGLSLSEKFYQPDVALLALLVAGVFAGFLVFNFHPATIFLGEAGSTFAGFILGVLAIISGAKIATALMILGIPILDVVWVVIQRLRAGESPFVGDRRHLHFKLLDLGLSHRQVVVLWYVLAALFGVGALFLQSFGKLVALGTLLAVMMVLVGLLAYTTKRNVVL